MTSLVTDRGIVHYETFGRGRPVLLLHGWLGSWELWRDTIAILGQNFRTYAIDFFGFGESTSTTENGFEVDTYVELVNQFMDRLGIVKAPLIGHSMGGTVSLSMAIKHPEKVVKVCVIGSPINGESLGLLLKLSGYPLLARFFWTSPFLFRAFLHGYSYLIARNGQKMWQMMDHDLSQISVNSFFQSIGTLRQTDLRPVLNAIKIPTLGIYGKRDIVVDPRQNEVLKLGVPQSEIIWYDDAGHFPMIDAPDRFIGNLHYFLNEKRT